MTDAIIEAAMQALLKLDETAGRDETRMDQIAEAVMDRIAEAVVAAVTPLIRAAALEEAAKVAEDEDGEYSWAGEHRNMALLQQHSRELAAAIRALSASPDAAGEG